MNTDDILNEIAQIRHGIDALHEMESRRHAITPENALPHVLLSQSYPVEVVARIAATCAGESHQERVVEALKLLEAAEGFVNPDPWESQSEELQAGDGLGETPDYAGEQVKFEFERMASEMIGLATDGKGQISRKELCRLACEKAGRVGRNGTRTSDDRIEALFLDEWLPYAADQSARWEVFRQVRKEQAPPCEAVVLAMTNYEESQASCAAFAARWQEICAEKQAAIKNGAPESVIAEVEERNLAAESAFRLSEEKVLSAEREISRAWDNFYSNEVDRRRGTLMEEQRKQESESFRLSLEKGVNTQPRIILDDTKARLLLLGTNEFRGLLEFLKFPPRKDSPIARPPRPRDASNRFISRPKNASGQYAGWESDGPTAEAFATPGLPSEPVERTEANRLRKKK